MAKIVVRKPASVETQIKNSINEAQRCFLRETGGYLPAKRTEFTWTGGDVTIVLYGERLAHKEVAEYRGPLGHWFAGLTLRGSGKPWRSWPS